MHVDLDTLATALYVRIDDELKASPQLNPYRPMVGIAPRITNAELITVSVMQVLLGYHNESRWVRYARKSVIHLFPYLPKQPGYNKRLRALTTQLTHVIAVLVTDTDLWHHPIRIADSTPVPCGMSRETAPRSDLDGWAGYGYRASHSRLFWGLRPHLVTTVHGLPVAFALSNAKTDEREVLVDLVTSRPNMFHHPDGLILVVDKGYRDRDTETWLNDSGITVIRPAYRTEPARPGRGLLRAVRQSIESVNQTFKSQLDLEHHGGSVNFDDLQAERRYSALRAQAQCGRANDLLGRAFAQQPSSKARYVLYHPGFTATLGSIGEVKEPVRTIITLLSKVAAKPVDKAIAPMVELIDNPPVERLTAIDRGKNVDLGIKTFDPANARRLAEVSRQLVVKNYGDTRLLPELDPTGNPS